MSSKRKSPPTKLDGNNGVTTEECRESSVAHYDDVPRVKVVDSFEELERVSALVKSHSVDESHLSNGDSQSLKSKRRVGDSQVSSSD